MPATDHGPGTLSEDLQYPRCIECDRNRTGILTERSSAEDMDWFCVMCGTHFDDSGRRRQWRAHELDIKEADPL